MQSFRAGSCQASIWANEVEQDGRTVTRHSVKFQKRYQDKSTSEWKNSDYYFPNDLPDLQLLCQEAFRFIRLRESDGNGSGE
ncbi:MAG: hypothetical protein D8M59_03650 [Planctomycetes bacterium]|nr:hypothetical protein [Planctomycetota bacterium]